VSWLGTVTKTDFIWYNSHLKINDKVLYLKCMSENGIKKIEDLIDDEQWAHIKCFQNAM
jgi:hypothetical protein